MIKNRTCVVKTIHRFSMMIDFYKMASSQSSHQVNILYVSNKSISVWYMSV